MLRAAVIGGLSAAMLILAGCNNLFFRPAPRPVVLASGAVTNPSKVEIDSAQTFTADQAIKLLNLKSNMWLAELRSPAVNYMPDTLQATEGTNEFYQVLAILIPVAGPYLTSFNSDQKLMAALLGAFVGYKAGKGSAVKQDKECQDLNAVITDIQNFDERWTAQFKLMKSGIVVVPATTRPAPATITIINPQTAEKTVLGLYAQMLNEEDKISDKVANVTNNCMNPYPGLSPAAGTTSESKTVTSAKPYKGSSRLYLH